MAATAAPRTREPSSPRPLALFVNELAAQDWLILGYLVVLLVACLLGSGPRRPQALSYLSLDFAAFVLALFLARARVLDTTKAAIAYRLGLVVGVFGSFAHLQYILPTATRPPVDAQIHAFDLAVFGFEPTQVMDRFVSPATVEWFSFFYFSYFFLIVGHVLAFMVFAKRTELLNEFSLGFIAIYCIGHVLYIAVPGHGPYAFLASHFTHPIDGPFWWRLVDATVSSAEVTARTDIFPSLHTAVPTFLALFAWRHRATRPFNLLWPVLAFFASQIIVSTMFLRWHYLIDVVAGLALAFSVAMLCGRVARWETRRRTRSGRAPVWTVSRSASPARAIS